MARCDPDLHNLMTGKSFSIFGGEDKIVWKNDFHGKFTVS